MMEYTGVSNETKSFHTRTTAGGRVLRYELTVLQQPERARACGQGAKYPPPIIELRIKEGENGEEDVTFKMNANYVIFASLEQARPIAKARGHQEKSTPTVLTGSPAAGMAYLERPAPAGYFIFSDLSVRHEGMYRLNFSLFEELKETADADKTVETSQDSADTPAGALIYRMDVRSLPFTVHSAKKFPGLTPSTDLSRTVAEQGCRVRIRRDVRMRRREQKPGAGGAGGDWDSYEDATADARARASATPDSRMHTPHHNAGYMEPIPRPRSASNASQQSSYQAAVSRRTSMQDIKQSQYPHASYPPNAPMTPTGYAHGVPYSPQQYHAPPPPAAYAQPQSNNAMAPPAYQPASHHAGHPAAPQYYPYGQEASHPPQHSAYEQRAYAPPPPQQQYSAPQAPPQASPHHHSGYASQHAPAVPAHNGPAYAPQCGRLPSAPTVPAQSAPAHRLERPSSTLPPLNTSFHNGYVNEHRLEPASPHHATAESSMPAMKSQKRAYGRVFNDAHQSIALRNGERPTAPSAVHSVPYPASAAPPVAADSSLAAGEDDDADCDLSSANMRYRRADGRQIRRALPAYPQPR